MRYTQTPLPLLDVVERGQFVGPRVVPSGDTIELSVVVERRIWLSRLRWLVSSARSVEAGDRAPGVFLTGFSVHATSLFACDGAAFPLQPAGSWSFPVFEALPSMRVAAKVVNTSGATHYLHVLTAWGMYPPDELDFPRMY